MGNKCCTCKEDTQDPNEHNALYQPPYACPSQLAIADPINEENGSENLQDNDGPTPTFNNKGAPRDNVSYDTNSDQSVKVQNANAPTTRVPDETAVKNISVTDIMEKLNNEENKHAKLKLLDVVPKEKLMSKNPNAIIYEGELLKLSPGVKEQHHPKWVQLTKKEFKYFKDRLSATEWLSRPLCVIPLARIDKVERVSVKLNSKGKKITELYQFEIFLKKSNETNSPKSDMKGSQKKTILGSHYNDRVLAAGIRDKKDYIDYVKNKGAELTKVTKKQQISGSGKSSWIKTLSGVDTWTNRETIWKNMIERNVYAHEDKLECEKWVFVVNWLIDLLNQA